MNIIQCLVKLGFNGEDFRLDSTMPPHQIIEWLSTQPQPTEGELEAAWASYVAEQSSTEYARNRRTAYDALNQFELMTDDAANSTTTHADAIAAIKAEFPKP